MLACEAPQFLSISKTFYSWHVLSRSVEKNALRGYVCTWKLNLQNASALCRGDVEVLALVLKIFVVSKGYELRVALRK